jgi:hypothetical protein
MLAGLLANTAFAARIIEITDGKGTVLYRETEPEEIQRISKVFQNPDSAYTPESKVPDPFSLPEELVFLVFKEGEAATARVGIMFYSSMVTYRKNPKEKFPGSLGVNRKLTEYVIELIEKGTLPPDSILTPQLRIENIREKAELKTKPNQPLQTMTMTVPVAAEPLCGPATVMSDR